MREINAQDYENVVKEEDVVVVDFWAPWCPTCRMMMPNIEAVEKTFDGKVAFCKLNVVENEAFAKELNLGTLPTIIFFKGGQEVQRVTGFKQKVQLNAMVEELLK